jgi:hypothetical protein
MEHSIFNKFKADIEAAYNSKDKEQVLLFSSVAFRLRWITTDTGRLPRAVRKWTKFVAMLAYSVSSLTNYAMKELKIFLNTGLFGPSCPIEQYRGEFHGGARVHVYTVAWAGPLVLLIVFVFS